jgi:propanol-preferring alcohol dehydrogenase
MWCLPIGNTCSSALDQFAEAADAVITFAPSDAVTEQALRALKCGGTLVIGIPLTVSGLPFNKEQMIKPSLLGSREQMRTVLQLAADGKVRTVVDRFPMEQAAEVLELLASGKLRYRGVLENVRS